MTDKEIIKAWEKVLSTGDAPIGEHWSVGGIVTTQLGKETLDLINRLQAEVERLKDYKQLYEDLKAEHLETIKLINKGIKTAKAEAYKEFVNKIKVHAYYIDFPKEHRVVDEDDIDNLLKELVGE